MLIVRAIVAALIAISVAMVPAAAGAYISTKPVEMSMAGHANTPCCTPDDCKDSIACAVKCFNFVGAVFPATVPLTHVLTRLRHHLWMAHCMSMSEVRRRTRRPV
jgi:hypothetical protein